MAASATTSFRVERDLEGPSRARAAVSRSLGGRVPATTLHDVLLVVSELVANAVIHGEGEIEVRAELADGQVRGEVRDRGRGFEPVVREHGAEPDGHRGLLIVSRLVRSWGVSDAHVWFAIDIPDGNAQVTERGATDPAVAPEPR